MYFIFKRMRNKQIISQGWATINEADSNGNSWEREFPSLSAQMSNRQNTHNTENKNYSGIMVWGFDLPMFPSVKISQADPFPFSYEIKELI